MLKINKTIVCAPIHFSDRSKDVPFCLELEPFSTNVLWWYSQSSEEDRELMRDFLKGNEIVRERCSVTFLAPAPKTNSARIEIFKAEMKLEKDLVNFASLLKLGSDFAADAGDRLALSSGLANFKFRYRGPMTYIFMLFGQDSAPIGRGPNLSTTEVNVCLPQLTEGPHSIVHGMREVANYCTRSIDQWIASGVMKHMSVESGGTRVAVRTAVQYGVMAGKTFDEIVEFLRNLCAFLNAYANFLESIMGAVRNHSRSDSTIVRNLCGLIAQAMKVSPVDYLDYEVEPIRKLAYWYVVGAV